MENLQVENVQSDVNIALLSGVIASPLVEDHKVTDKRTKSVAEVFYKFMIDGEHENGDTYQLPVTVPESVLKKMRKKTEVGQRVFLKGNWRAYDKKDIPNGTDHTVQTFFVKTMESISENASPKNKFTFVGTIVRKLEEAEKDEKGKIKRDSTGKPISLKDEKGNVVYGTRMHRFDKREANDITIAINRINIINRSNENGEKQSVKKIAADYIPCVAFEELAKHIAFEVPLFSQVKGVGYMRSRKYKNRRTKEETTAYEIVITELKVVALPPKKEENA